MLGLAGMMLHIENDGEGRGEGARPHSKIVGAVSGLGDELQEANRVAAFIEAGDKDDEVGDAAVLPNSSSLV